MPTRVRRLPDGGVVPGEGYVAWTPETGLFAPAGVVVLALTANQTVLPVPPA